ncbi:MAG: 5-(carboxyamino)imidazole ribonucleotide synthase [Rhizobiaceae bacterium]
MTRTTRAPGSTIGILGGGQLGRMLAMAAARLGYRTIIYDPDPHAPAAQMANHHHCASWTDNAALDAFAAACDLITFEFENIPVETAARLNAIRPVHPSPSALEVSQDRLVEKRFLNGLDIATAPFTDVASEAELAKALREMGGRAILKTRRMGYDGKGQFRLASEADARLAWRALEGTPAILEGFVPFDAEISVIGARGHDGGFAAYAPARNEHANGILSTSNVPSGQPAQILEQARAITRTIMDSLGYCGVLGVEFFVAGNTLLVNEIAPRVHNSGHWTEAACLISQFEQHIRAVCGLPLGETANHSSCRMENLIGDAIDRVPGLLKQGNCHIHLYGKRETRPGRKMGHVTWLTRN